MQELIFKAQQQAAGNIDTITKSIFNASQRKWVHAKLDKLVTSLSQLPINYYRHIVKMNVHQSSYN